MDNAEEQQNELEALEAIYQQEFQRQTETYAQRERERERKWSESNNETKRIEEQKGKQICMNLRYSHFSFLISISSLPSFSFVCKWNPLLRPGLI